MIKISVVSVIIWLVASRKYPLINTCFLCIIWHIELLTSFLGAILWSSVWWCYCGHEDFAHHGSSHSDQRKPCPQVPHSSLPELVSFDTISSQSMKDVGHKIKGRQLKITLPSFISYVWMCKYVLFLLLVWW